MDPNAQTRQQNNSTPPWEQRPVRQVPFVVPSPGLVERKPSRAESNGSVPRLDVSSGRSTPGAAYVSPVATEYSHRPWQSPQPSPAPYETRMQAPSGRRAESTDFMATRAPPTPPDSVKLAASRNNSQASEEIRRIKALNGTMSSREDRERSQSKRRARPEASAPTIQTAPLTTGSHGFGTKFKSAMRDLFHRSPVDPADCEPLKVRHWAEDDY